MNRNDIAYWRDVVQEGDMVAFKYTDSAGNKSNVTGYAKMGYRRPKGTGVSTRVNVFSPYSIEGMSINTKTKEVFLDIDSPESDRADSKPSVFKRYSIKRVKQLKVV